MHIYTQKQNKAKRFLKFSIISKASENEQQLPKTRRCLCICNRKTDTQLPPPVRKEKEGSLLFAGKAPANNKLSEGPQEIKFAQDC